MQLKTQKCEKKNQKEMGNRRRVLLLCMPYIFFPFHQLTEKYIGWKNRHKLFVLKLEWDLKVWIWPKLNSALLKGVRFRVLCLYFQGFLLCSLGLVCFYGCFLCSFVLLLTLLPVLLWKSVFPFYFFPFYFSSFISPIVCTCVLFVPWFI